MTLTLAPLPIIDGGRCAVGSAGADGCRACVDTCPYDAMDIRSNPEGSEVRIDPLLCQRCGACSGVCPTSAIERPFLPDDELVSAMVTAARANAGAVVAVTCPASHGQVAAAVGADQVVITPSLLIINETHLLATIAAGARAVLLVGCPRCTHDQPQRLLAPLSTARAIIDDPRRVAYLAAGAHEVLAVAVEDRQAMAAPALHPDVTTWAALDAADTRRERLTALLPAFGAGATTPLAVAGFGRVALDLDSCVACGACAIACPTDALNLDPASATLSVTDLECIGCGTCASVCPDDAITVEPAVPIGAAAMEPRVLLSDESVACRSCGDHYAPRRLLDHARAVLVAAELDPDDPRFQLGVCPTCRNPEARQVPIDVIRESQSGCGCTGGGGCSPPAGSGGCGSDGGCVCSQDSQPADALDITRPSRIDVTASDEAVPTGPGGIPGGTRRGLLKGAAAVSAMGALLPLVSRNSPVLAAQVEEAPVIVPGRMGMVIDLDRCIGCHACTNVCKAENNVPLGKFRDWVEEHVLGEYPHARPVFLPKLCNHCDDPGCLRACPTGAIHKRADGIVDLDPDICIACQACMQGCPYGMTFYNHQRGTADKCNLCAHRIDEGMNPACVDICPSQCRIVGDFDDPDSPVSQYLAERNSDVLREDYGLGPNIRYVGLPGELDR